MYESIFDKNRTAATTSDDSDSIHTKRKGANFEKKRKYTEREKERVRGLQRQKYINLCVLLICVVRIYNSLASEEEEEEEKEKYNSKNPFTNERYMLIRLD